MPVPADVSIRRAEPGDLRAAFAVFRRSIMVYVHKLGIVESPDVDDAMVAEQWHGRGVWIEHLWRTAEHNWVAEDPDGKVVGWAMSVRRGPTLELTHFFVDPGAQSGGLGRALLERALPVEPGDHRSIIATQDPRALRLYLQRGVRYVSAIADFYAAPRRVEVETDLEFEAVEPSKAAVDRIGAIEAVLLGHRRDVDIEFVLQQRPAWIARRDGRDVGFAFGAVEELCGPIGTLDPADLPALLGLVEDRAAATGMADLYYSVPLVNATAVEYLLGRGYRIDEMIVGFLADDAWAKLDRWIHTGYSYII